LDLALDSGVVRGGELGLKKSFEQRKEMTFDPRLLNITAAVVRGLYCFSFQNLVKKALHEIMVNRWGGLRLCRAPG